MKTFTEVPQADLVKVMKTDGAGNGVDEDGVGDRTGDDVGEVDFEEIGATKHWAIVEVADADED